MIVFGAGDPGLEAQSCYKTVRSSRFFLPPSLIQPSALSFPLMVGKLIPSALVSMEPRNVMLDKKNKKKIEEKEPEVKNEGEKIVATELAGSLESKPADGGLLRAIASFLGRHGFSKTLAALQSESLGVMDNSSLTDAIKLEYVYHKYLKDGCAVFSDGQFSGFKEKDSLGDLQINGGTEVDNSNAVALGDLSEMHPTCKEKKKKKHRKTSDSSAEDTKQSENEKFDKFGNLGDALENVKSVCTVLDGKSKDATLPLAEPKHGKKKRKKLYTSQEEDASQNHGKVSQEGSAEKFNDLPTSEVVKVNGLKGSCYTVSLNEECLSYKNKKKKSRSTSDGLLCGNGKTEDCLLLEGVESTDKGDAEMVCVKAAKHVDTDVQPHHLLTTFNEKKRKRKSTAEDLQAVDSKDICCLTSHEDASGGGEGMVKEEIHNLISKDAELAQVKKGKKFKDLVNEPVQEPYVQVAEQSKKFVKTSTLKQGLKSDTEGNPEAVNSLNIRKVHANGNIENKELGGYAAETLEKGSKGSAEPKTVNAFRRVNPDEVTFADERLQNNSYWAKSGAESGYGAKAQEVLGQVRGKDFRHEKTKKKRGSYRGGSIDFQSHSIKFNYSDDE